MANDKIEDVIRKVVLGESFMAEDAKDVGPGPGDEDENIVEDGEDGEGFDVVEEEVLDEEAIDEAKDEDDDEDDDEDEDEDEEEEEDEGKGKKGKMPAFLKAKFKKKMEEAVSDYASDKMYKTANGKTAQIAEPTGDASGKNMATIKAKKSDANGKVEKPSMKKEDIDALFSGTELSEEFKSQAATVFEAHLNERVRQVEESLQGQYETLLEEHTAAVTEELIERIDDYLAYVVEEWMQENRLAVESGLRTEIAEDFIGNLRNLFNESYITVPEDKTDLFDEALNENSTLNEELSQQVQKNIGLAEEIEQLKCEIVFREIAEGLTDTEVEKLRRLAEDVEFETVDQFAEKLGVLRENIETIGSVTEGSSPAAEDISESVEDASEELSPLMEAYLRSMSKSQV